MQNDNLPSQDKCDGIDSSEWRIEYTNGHYWIQRKLYYKKWSWRKFKYQTLVRWNGVGCNGGYSGCRYSNLDMLEPPHMPIKDLDKAMKLLKTFQDINRTFYINV